MKIVREVIVFDAADMRAESTFWAGIIGGHVFEDEAWHSVIDAAGNWRIGVQLKPDHVPPEWPQGLTSVNSCAKRASRLPVPHPTSKAELPPARRTLRASRRTMNV